MGLRTDKQERFTLPEVINPPESLCFTIKVPKDRYHLAAFFGALYDLTQWFNWTLDGTHHAADAAKVWRQIWLNLQSQSCDIPPQTLSVFEEEEMSLTRTVCENGQCFLEFQCCPDEWIRLANANQLTNGTQPATGTPPPPPGGGTQQVCAKLNANSTILLPTLVSTGDTILLVSASGAGWDGGEFDFGPLWRLPNGDQFVGGLDVGFPTTMSGDPIPSSHHMDLIVAIGATPTYIALTEGIAVTVPGGITNAQVYVQVNDSAIGNNQGDYNICVRVTNNAAQPWSHTLNFALSPYGFMDASIGAVTTWSPGTGWTCPGTTGIDSIISRSFPSTTITHVEYVLNDASSAPAGSSGAELRIPAGGTGYALKSPLTSGDNTASQNMSVTAISLDLIADDGAVDGNFIWRSLKLSGTGADPFPGAPA